MTFRPDPNKPKYAVTRLFHDNSGDTREYLTLEEANREFDMYASYPSMNFLMIINLESSYAERIHIGDGLSNLPNVCIKLEKSTIEI